jgi:beta-glucosidase/6-phospho-beta-glucosidase/beta-galactosidase
MGFFNSYFIAGYECADHLNAQGIRVNLLKETAHDQRVEEDYQLIKNIGISSAREGICWSEVEKKPYHYDFSEVLERLKMGNQMGVQQIWDVMHFGCPADLYPTHPQFENRFVALCRAFVNFYHQNCSEPLLIVPINEISFHSWFAGESKGTAPYVKLAGWEVKYALCKAVISGIKAIKILSPGAIISVVEPLVAIHADHDSCPEDIAQQNNYQFQAVDIITGKICPELGGQEDLIDLIGINYYWNCQWRPNGGTLPWPEINQDRIPLVKLINNLYQKYHKPLWISETGHIGEGRAEWLEEITKSVMECAEIGIKIHGVCLYPVIDRPDWDNLLDYHNSGIWDLDAHKNRIPYQDLVNVIMRSQLVLNRHSSNDQYVESNNYTMVNKEFSNEK